MSDPTLADASPRDDEHEQQQHSDDGEQQQEEDEQQLDQEEGGDEEQQAEEDEQEEEQAEEEEDENHDDLESSPRTERTDAELEESPRDDEQQSERQTEDNTQRSQQQQQSELQTPADTDRSIVESSSQPQQQKEEEESKQRDEEDNEPRIITTSTAAKTSQAAGDDDQYQPLNDSAAQVDDDEGDDGGAGADPTLADASTNYSNQNNQADDSDSPSAHSSNNDNASNSTTQNGTPPSQSTMPDILKVVINRAEIEAAEDSLFQQEEEKHEGGDDSNRNAPIPEQVVYVQIIRDNLHHPKPYLGGYRHKYYATTYHHSSTQTARKKKKAEVIKFHRETQTIQIVSRSQQTNRDVSTQMERRDLVLDTSKDKVIISKPYFSSDELDTLRDEKAREVQCFLRQCFAWRRVRRLKEEQQAKLQEQQLRDDQLKRQAEANHTRQIQRRMHPRSKEDFHVLYSELEAWRLHETRRIKESVKLSAEERSAALQELLHKEVKLLQTIDRLKITASKENKLNSITVELEKMSSPKEWQSKDGDLIEVETPFTIRSRELVDLYNGLCLRNLSRPQRIDILLHIKYTVKEFDCELSREIIELIKREEDLLRRQRSEQSLEGCRKRLQNLFLNFVQTPSFNPEAATFQRVPIQDASTSSAASASIQPALSSSIAKPAMLTRTNTITSVASNVAGRIFAAKQNGGRK